MGLYRAQVLINGADNPRRVSSEFKKRARARSAPRAPPDRDRARHPRNAGASFVVVCSPVAPVRVARTLLSFARNPG